MIVLHVAKTAGEWREAVMERDSYRCQAVKHDSRCRYRAEHAHHIVYKSTLCERSHWIIENGIALSDVCHQLAHAEKNRNLDLSRCNVAVAAVNCTESIKVKRFTKKAA